MSAYWLKMLALAAMFVDHMGAILFPGEMAFRVVGRLTMPILCFLIGEGYRHTRNVKKYLGRLLLFAFLSEVPFDLAFSGTVFNPFHQNVFFTLFLGLLSIHLFERYRQGPGALLVLLCGMAANFLMCDYGTMGVILVVGLYLYGRDRRGLLLVLVVLNVLLEGLSVQAAAVLAFIPISLYDGQRGPDLKYAFYLFYPLHLLFLAYLAFQSGAWAF